MAIARFLVLNVFGCLSAIAPVVFSNNAAPVAAEQRGWASQATAILVSATNAPLRVTGSDGSDHLEYDLLVTNTIAAPVALTSLAVLDPEGATLLRLDGDALAQVTQPVDGVDPMREIPGSGMAAVVLDVVIPVGRPLERLTHRIAYDVASDAPVRRLIGSFEIDGPALEIDPRRATVIAPPVRAMAGWPRMAAVHPLLDIVLPASLLMAPTLRSRRCLPST